MLLLYCSRTLMSSSIGITLKSNLRRSSGLCAGTFKPVRVSYSKLNINQLFKRNYIRQNRGNRQRKYDGLPEGLELIYQAKYNMIYFCFLCTCYLSLGFTSWYIIKSYVLENKEESKNLNIFNMFTITKADPTATTVFATIGGIAAIALQCAFKTPRRLYIKDNELTAVTYGFLGPFRKKFVKCTLDEIRPLAPIAIMPWRELKYDFKGVRLFLFRNKFRYSVPKSSLIGKNKPLKTQLNHFVDKVKELILLRRK